MKDQTATKEVKDLKEGEFVELNHCRKGRIFGQVKSIGDEWMTVILLDKVSGLVNTWIKGEELTSRNSFVKVVQVSETEAGLKGE